MSDVAFFRNLFKVLNRGATQDDARADTAQVLWQGSNTHSVASRHMWHRSCRSSSCKRKLTVLTRRDDWMSRPGRPTLAPLIKQTRLLFVQVRLMSTRINHSIKLVLSFRLQRSKDSDVIVVTS